MDSQQTLRDVYFKAARDTLNDCARDGELTSGNSRRLHYYMSKLADINKSIQAAKVEKQVVNKIEEQHNYLCSREQLIKKLIPYLDKVRHKSVHISKHLHDLTSKTDDYLDTFSESMDIESILSEILDEPGCHQNESMVSEQNQKESEIDLNIARELLANVYGDECAPISPTEILSVIRDGKILKNLPHCFPEVPMTDPRSKHGDKNTSDGSSMFSNTSGQ